MNATLPTKNYVHDELRPCGTPSKERHPRSFVGKESRKRSMRRSIDKQLRRWYSTLASLHCTVSSIQSTSDSSTETAKSQVDLLVPIHLQLLGRDSRRREASPQHHAQHRNTKIDEGQETTVESHDLLHATERCAALRPDRDACSLSRLAANRSGEWPAGRHVGFFRAAHTLGHLSTLSARLYLYLYLSLSLSLSFSLCEAHSLCEALSLSLSFSISISLFLSLRSSLSLRGSISISIFLYLYLSLSLSAKLTLSGRLYLYLYLSLSLSLSLSIYLYLYLFLSFSISLFLYFSHLKIFLSNSVASVSESSFPILLLSGRQRSSTCHSHFARMRKAM